MPHRTRFLSHPLCVFELCPEHSKPISPRTQLAEIFPDQKRRYELWRQFESELKLKTPNPLSRPKWVCNAIAVGSAAVTAVVGMVCFFPVFLIVVLLASLLILFLATEPLRVCFGTDTVGWLARQVAAKNTRALLDEIGSTWTRANVWSTLSLLVQQQLGVSEDQILPEARFVEDLGVD